MCAVTACIFLGKKDFAASIRMTPLKNFSNAVAVMALMYPPMDSGQKGPRISTGILRLLTPLPDLPSVEAYKPHQRLRLEYDGQDMREEGETGGDAHEVDQKGCME